MNAEPTDAESLDARGPLHILHLEDNSLDQEVVRQILAKAGLHCEFTYVASRAAFEEALERSAFDLILSDFTLPSYDGAAALAAAHALCPEIPFVFVSGTMGEERAIESLKDGATDYVLKNNLARLPRAVKRALLEAKARAQRQETEEALRSAKEAAEIVAARLQHTTEALQASEAFLHSVVENLPVIVYRKDPEGRLTFANQHYCERRGQPLAELLGQTDFDLSPPDLAKKYWADNVAVMASRQPIDKVEMQILPNGQRSWIHIIKVPVTDRDDRVIGTQGMYWDVTERMQAEESLRHSEERFREMAESIRDVFWVITPDAQQVLYVSPAYEAVWGRSVDSLYASPASWREMIVAEDRPRVLAAFTELAGGADYRIQYRIRRPDGALRWIEDRGYAVRNSRGEVERTLGVAVDVTERKELESQLLHAQKMEAIGQLAGGVAHDFNNILTVITGYSGLLLDGALRPEDLQESLKQIYSAGERASRLTRQLLLFSRRHRLDIQTADLNNIIDDVAKMLRRLIGEDLALEVTLASRLPPIRADAGMMEQVLMNLVVNARDAMPRGGRLVIKTEVATISAADAKQRPDSRAGEFVRLSVRDSGCGIPADVLPRIFEPYFTTKDPGKGTGLGLATVFGIVKQHQGWITVDSGIGAGTTFEIYLPASPAGASVAPESRAALEVSGGQETILLVEDEASVRDFAAAVLQHYGYRVLQAASGVDALEVWLWHSQRIALLVTDLVMPGNMTGVELAEKLQAEKPVLKVICTSGYSGDMMEQSFAARPDVQFLHKPYPPRALAKAVRDALDRAAGKT